MNQTQNILSKAVLYEVSLACWGTERKVDLSKVDVTARNQKGEDEKGEDPNKNVLRLTKSLIKCPELDAIKQLDGKIRQYIYKRALPSVRRSGVYFLPLPMVKDVEARMEEFKEERAALVGAFCAVYEMYKDAAAKELGALYEDKDYPTVGEVRDAFAFATSFQAAGVAEGLKDAYPEIFAKEQEKAEKAWAEASEAIQQVLREGLKNVVDHMADRLKGNGAGKPKVFRDSLVTNMTEFLEWFEPRNVTDDTKLSELVARCKTVMDGVTPTDLRDTPKVRKAVLVGVESVKAELDKLMVDKPGRKTLSVS